MSQSELTMDGYPDRQSNPDRSVYDRSSSGSSYVSDDENKMTMDTNPEPVYDPASIDRQEKSEHFHDNLDTRQMTAQKQNQDLFNMSLTPNISGEASRPVKSGHTGSQSGKFEGPGDNNVDSETGELASGAHSEAAVGPSIGKENRSERGSSHLQAATDQMARPAGSLNISAPIASLSDVDLTDSDDNELDLSLRGPSTSDDLEESACTKQVDEALFGAPSSTAPAAECSKFEEAKRHDDFSSPKHRPTEPASFREKLTDFEHEKDRLLLDADEEEMDVVTELRVTSPSVQNKEQVSSSGLNLLDLPSPQETSPGLNLDASKQKVQLRQRGSLAKRRKPTRTSIRSTSQTEDIFTHNTDKPVINGYGVSMETTPSSQSEASTPDKEHAPSMTNIDMSASSQGEIVKLGKNIHGIKTAIVQSELVESGRQRLRSVPTPSTTEKRASTSDEHTSVAPPWLLEAKLRRSSRPPRGETEKLRQDSEPETPAWLKEALTKKRRASSSRMTQSSTDDLQESTHSTSVPWIQEASLRRSRRPEPLSVSQKDLVNNANNILNDSSRDEVFDDDGQTDVVAVEKTDSIISSTRRDAAGRMGDRLHEQENTPPPKAGMSSARTKSLSEVDASLCRFEKLTPSSKRIMSPGPSSARKMSQQINMSPTRETEEPIWKAEIAMRRKSKSYVVAQKPEQPLRLGEMPQWKKDLLEKNKQRRVSSDGTEAMATTVTGDKRAEPSTKLSEEPPWKVELAQRRGSRLGSTGVAPQALETLIERQKSQVKPPEEEPEWAQLVARRRQRLASSGLLPPEECAKIE